jgi:hypothetical protein
VSQPAPGPDVILSQPTAPPPAGPGRPHRGPASAFTDSRLLVALFLVSLAAVTPRIYASDEVQYFAFLRSLWFDHDLSFDNEYRYFYDSGAVRTPGFKETFLDGATKTGRRENFGTIGCALLWSPFYAVADLGVRAARAAGWRVAADGYSTPYLAAVAYGSAVYGFAALLLSAHACRFVFAGRGEPRLRETAGGGAVASRAAMTAVWLGTPLLFYMYVAPVFSHAVSAFAVAAFVVAWLHVRRTWSPGGVMALGALAALMAMVREQDVFVAGGVVLDFAWAVASQHPGKAGAAGTPARQNVLAGPRLVAVALAGAATAVVAYLPQAIAYLRINGRLGPSALVTRKMSWTSPHAGQVLASPEHGLFFWTPLAALAIAGLLIIAFGAARASEKRAGSSQNDRRPAERARIVVCLLVMAALQVYVAGAVGSWSVAGAFGQRRFVALTVVFVVGVAALLRSARRRSHRALALAAVVLAAWWNVALIVQFATGLMDRQRLTLASNAYNAFVVVPLQLPRVAYRYVFNRESFYAPRQVPGSGTAEQH